MKDYTGSNPFECSLLKQYLTARHNEQSTVHSPSAASSSSGSAVQSPLSSAIWSRLLEEWKKQRMRDFGEMLIDYHSRFLQNEPVLSSALKTVRALDLRLPVKDFVPSYDRRLMFERRGEAELGEVPGKLYMDSISPLVRLQVRDHYSSLLLQHQDTTSLAEAIKTMLRSTELMTNDAKGRLVQSYIIHSIRQHINSKSEGVTIPLLEGGNWSKSREFIKFEFADADIVDFPGKTLPLKSVLGDLKKPKYYFPINTNYPEFDFFYFKPARDDLSQPSVLYRISITVNLTNHGYNPNVCNLGEWQSLLSEPAAEAGIPRLTRDYYTWMAIKDQDAPAPAAGATYLLDFKAMAVNGFPWLEYLKLRS